MPTVITEAQRAAGAAAIEDLLEQLAINPHERGETGRHGEAEGPTIAETLANAVLNAAIAPELALTAQTYVHPGRIPAFTVTVGERARDLRTGNEGVVVDIRRETRYAPWKVVMRLDRDGLTWQFFAHTIVAPKGA